MAINNDDAAVYKSVGVDQKEMDAKSETGGASEKFDSTKLHTAKNREASLIICS